MGLLDSFMGQGWDDPKSQAVMALAGGLLSGDFGAGVQGYGKVMSSAKDEAMKRKLAEMQMAEAQAKMAQEAKLREMFTKYQTPAQQGLAPLTGNAELGIQPSAGRRASPAGYDYQGLAAEMASVDPLKALALQAQLQKETPVNKLDVKDFTPASVAKFMETKNYGDLVRLDKAHFANVGGQTVAADPFTGKPLNAIQNTQSPDNAATVGATLRGQNLTNALGWANHNQSGQRLQFDQQQAGKPQFHGDQWVTPPASMAPGTAVPAVQPVSQRDAKEALNLINTAREIIPNSTGSYLGTGIDQAARVFGASTGGDTAAAQLRALEGALVSKMPKMSGPQSDKDVALYKQMAGEIGDPTIPQSRKLAALKVIEEIQMRNAGSQPATQPTMQPTMRWNPKTGTIEMVN